MICNLVGFSIRLLESGSINIIAETRPEKPARSVYVTRQPATETRFDVIITATQIKQFVAQLFGQTDNYYIFDDLSTICRPHPDGIKFYKFNCSGCPNWVWLIFPGQRLANRIVNFLETGKPGETYNMSNEYITYFARLVAPVVIWNFQRLQQTDNRVYNLKDFLVTQIKRETETQTETGNRQDCNDNRVWNRETRSYDKPENWVSNHATTRLINSLKSLAHIARNRSNGKPVSINLYFDNLPETDNPEETDKPINMYFEVVDTETGNRVINGAIIAHYETDETGQRIPDRYTYSTHT